MKPSTHRARVCASLATALALGSTAFAQSMHGEVWGIYASSFGASVAAIGDVDNDGFPDYIVGAPSDNSAGPVTGAAYVVSGRFNSVVRVHNDGASASMAGFAVAGGHDLNGDGVPDYAVGYPRTNVGNLLRAGMVRVFSGKDGALLQTFFGTHAAGELGRSMVFVGDVDGDGVADLAVGAPIAVDAATNAHGIVRVFSGKTGLVINTLHTVYDGFSGFGTALAAIGDWNGDGLPDIACGMPLWQSGATPNVGGVRVLSIVDNAVLFTALPPQPSSDFGRSVAALPDSNGDGRQELLVGAPMELDLGAVHFIPSTTKHIQMTLRGQAVYAQFGHAIAAAGDVDKDGKPDFAVTSPGGGTEALRVFTTNGVTLWTPLMKSSKWLTLGTALALLGDADGDGRLDLVLTDDQMAPNGISFGGAALVRLAHHQPNLGFDGDGNSHLSVHGTPLWTGGQADVHVSFGGPNRPGILLVSPFYSPLPILGGTLIPHLSGLQIPFTTDVHGAFTLPNIIPGGLGNVSLYAQAAVVAPHLPQGLGLTNAVRIDFLP